MSPTNREKRKSLETGEPPVYEPVAIPEHKHGELFHEHPWTEGDGHSHGAELWQEAEPTGETISSSTPRPVHPWVREDRKTFKPSDR